MRTLRARAFSRAAVAVLLGTVTSVAPAVDIDALWEYADAAVTETRSRMARARTTGDAMPERPAQTAWTDSLQRDFAAAYALLDEVEPQLGRPAPAGALPARAPAQLQVRRRAQPDGRSAKGSR